MNQNINLSFVYGTLKQGFHNHRVMKHAGGEFVGEATLSGATMYSLGGFPGIVLDDSDNTVVGEVYSVKDFAPLDYLEGYPSFYDRKVVETSLGKAWVYFLPQSSVKGLSVVKNGVWE